MSRFRKSDAPRLTREEMIRQGRIVNVAQAALADLASVRAFLNTHHDGLGGRPIDLAVASDDGLYESGAGQPRMRHATVLTSFLPYTLNFPAAGTVPRNTVTNMSISATMTPADFDNARVGAYADTLVLSITP